MKWYLHAFKNFTNFDGRASRTEYWMFVVLNTTFAIACYTIDLILNINFEQYGFGPIYVLYALIALIPGLALSVRRLHDVDRNGYFILIVLLPIIGSIWLIILFLMKGNEDENDYGEKPINNEIPDFISFDKANTIIICICLFWMFFNKLFWTIISKSSNDYYQNKSFLFFNELINSVWMFFPLLLSFTIKNPKLKIILIILSMIYLIYSFYQLIVAHQMTTDKLQF